jgi:hypothetical protein
LCLKRLKREPKWVEALSNSNSKTVYENHILLNRVVVQIRQQQWNVNSSRMARAFYEITTYIIILPLFCLQATLTIRSVFYRKSTFLSAKRAHGWGKNTKG